MNSISMVLCLLGALSASDGTIVVLEGSNPVVSRVTSSRITHVGMIVNIAGQPYVYEATPAVVRRTVLTEYYNEVTTLNRGRSVDQRVRMTLYQPARPYSAVERNQLHTFLAAQVGRRYSVRGYIRNKPGDGIHCAELISTALTRTGRYQFPPHYSVSPISLVTHIRPSHLAPFELPARPRKTNETWCDRSWRWWSGAFAWCGWACRETSTLWP